MPKRQPLQLFERNRKTFNRMPWKITELYLKSIHDWEQIFPKTLLSICLLLRIATNTLQNRSMANHCHHDWWILSLFSRRDILEKKSKYQPLYYEVVSWRRSRNNRVKQTFGSKKKSKYEVDDNDELNNDNEPTLPQSLDAEFSSVEFQFLMMLIIIWSWNRHRWTVQVSQRCCTSRWCLPDYAT